MNIERYRPDGFKDTTKNVTLAAADKLYRADAWMAEVPFSKYYRIVLRDESAGNRIVRDTDHEVFGRQSMMPSTVKVPDYSSPPFSQNKYAVGFGSKGE